MRSRRRFSMIPLRFFLDNIWQLSGSPGDEHLEKRAMFQEQENIVLYFTSSFEIKQCLRFQILETMSRTQTPSSKQMIKFWLLGCDHVVELLKILDDVFDALQQSIKSVLLLQLMLIEIFASAFVKSNMRYVSEKIMILKIQCHWLT